MNKKFVNLEEWLFYINADLDSAEILLKTSQNYHIVAYHAHQAVEKLLKRFLMLNSKTFPFVHDLTTLLKQINQITEVSQYLEEVSFLMDIYANTRYPQGDLITEDEARRSVEIAKNLYTVFHLSTE